MIITGIKLWRRYLPVSRTPVRVNWVFLLWRLRSPYRPNVKYAYYPASGHLHFQSGDLEYVSQVGFIWSSTVASNGSSYGFMFDENTEVDFDYKFYSSQGTSVRCQKMK